jgi:hypothetical protein
VTRYPDSRPLKRFDNLFEGDVLKWIKFANSLKLRLALRIVYVDPALAQQCAEEAVSHLHGVITSNADNALLATRGSSVVNNPLKKIWDDYGDTRLGATFESYLKGYADPRLDARFSKATYNTDNTYYGVRTGITISESQRTSYQKFSTPKIDANTPMLWMAAPEVYLLRAEGALRGWNMNGTAEALYKRGVETSFEREAAAGYADYIDNTTALPANYKDPTDGTLNTAAVSTITIGWNEADGFEKKLERIITQKWIALYPDGQEAWSEFRRTAYPKQIQVNTNHSNGVISNELGVRRLPFSTKEYSTNAAEVEKAVKLLGDGGALDNGATKLWWDKK